MESVSLEMDDIFGDRLREEEDVDQIPEMLPDLPEGGADNYDEQGTQREDESENQKVLSKLKGMKGASKNTVKRPMPKLDATRLTGERGIPILPRIFQDVKLKGKGHEVEDLRTTMRYLEHWAHRLFPKMPFDEVVEKIERLGSKKEVQTCVKKMRLDMPVIGSDTVRRGADEDDDNEGENDSHGQQEPTGGSNAEAMFDAMIQEEQAMEAELNDGDTVPSQRQRQQSGSAGTRAASQTDAMPGTSVSSQTPAQGGLSADVLERIERNKRLAMEKRAKKLGIPLSSLSPKGNISTQPSTSSQSHEEDVQPANSTMESLTSRSGLDNVDSDSNINNIADVNSRVNDSEQVNTSENETVAHSSPSGINAVDPSAGVKDAADASSNVNDNVDSCPNVNDAENASSNVSDKADSCLNANDNANFCPNVNDVVDASANVNDNAQSNLSEKDSADSLTSRASTAADDSVSKQIMPESEQIVKNKIARQESSDQMAMETEDLTPNVIVTENEKMVNNQADTEDQESVKNKNTSLAEECETNHTTKGTEGSAISESAMETDETEAS